MDEVRSINSHRNLNEEQRLAVLHGSGPLLIIAGAGTGKTTVITERIVDLIEDKKIDPEHILALTFTEKASQEMQERVDIAMPYGYSLMWISTFHSFCDRILRSEGLHIGIDPSYKLMSQAETIQFIRSNLFSFDLDYFRPLGNPTKFISGLIQHFSRLQDEDIRPSEYLSWVKKSKEKLTSNSRDEEIIEIKKWEELSCAYQKYEEFKLKEGKMDYGDLISKVLLLFRSRPNVLKYYREKFQYILVDEFQDTNIAQYELIKLLADPMRNPNITVVGDDSQSIYKFRGAAISNILRFKDDFPNTTTVVLTKNYRSLQTILDASYKLIQYNNPDTLEVRLGIKKKLVSMRKQINSDKVIEFIHTKHLENETEEVARHIHELVKKDYSYGDIAILVRANNHAEAFMKAFQRCGIPYQFLGPGKLFRQPEILELIAYLKVLYNCDDSLSFYKVLSIDSFGIDSTDIIKLLNYSKKVNKSVYEISENIDSYEEDLISEDSKQKLQKIVVMIQGHIEKIKSETAGQLLYSFISESGILQGLYSLTSESSERKAQNISKFFDKIKSFEVDHSESTLFEVVDWIDLSLEVGESPLSDDSDWNDNDAVNILTVHGSKGLEFPVVFLVNLVSLRFPSTDRKELIPIPTELIKEVLPVGDYHLQEERRLFYVGVTRAKDKLFLTASDQYSDSKRQKKISQFVFESLNETFFPEKSIVKEVTRPSFSDFKQSQKVQRKLSTAPLSISYLSYSQIETFLNCPLHYKLQYLTNVPTQPSAAQSFGTSIHNALYSFYQKLKAGEKPTEKLILSCLETSWVPFGYINKDHEKTNKDVGEKYLTDFLTSDCFQNPQKVVALEEKFMFPLPKKEGEKPLKIGGKIDRIDVLDSRHIEIIDYKTGRVPEQKEVDKNMQLSFYALAASHMRTPPFPKQCEDITLSLYYFSEHKKFSTKRTMVQLNEVIDEIYAIRRQIQESSFSCTNPIFCENCEFHMFCNMDSK